jgi:hypothetical protein
VVWLQVKGSISTSPLFETHTYSWADADPEAAASRRQTNQKAERSIIDPGICEEGPAQRTPPRLSQLTSPSAERRTEPMITPTSSPGSKLRSNEGTLQDCQLLKRRHDTGFVRQDTHQYPSTIPCAVADRANFKRCRVVSRKHLKDVSCYFTNGAVTFERNRVNQHHSLANQASFKSFGLTIAKSRWRKKMLVEYAVTMIARPHSQWPLPTIASATSFAGSTTASGVATIAKD